MAMRGAHCRVCINTWVHDSQDIFKTILGGPLLGKDARFHGIIYDHYDNGDAIVRYNFLSLELLCERLDPFEILNEVTPFLPKQKIARVLRRVINFPLPSESEEYDHPIPLDVGGGQRETSYTGKKIILDDKWPVPEPYWHHGGLDADRYHVPELPGRQLH
ncbi:hypothetical protein C2845_PM03G03330 [Panicum miliaceum]|uniref:Uncharacterized protein n=1 Tax=Panicum miliaceum TaxID=4540 RepID=A0A3L6T9R5_PANMI|nr:hypothetical protein C2845_PM03G03330 [Panicum miliaceum]